VNITRVEPSAGQREYAHLMLGMRNAYLEAGFTRLHALALVCTHILADATLTDDDT